MSDSSECSSKSCQSARPQREEIKPERVHQHMHVGDIREIVQLQYCYFTKDRLHGAYFNS